MKDREKERHIDRQTDKEKEGERARTDVLSEHLQSFHYLPYLHHSLTFIVSARVCVIGNSPITYN